MAALKTGDTVRLKVPVPQGEIKQTRYDVDTGEASHLLEWEADGVVQERWFSPEELEIVSE